MKKFALFLSVALVLSSAHAEATVVEEMNSEKALTKFSRGVTNVATSPGEFVVQIPPAMEQSPDYLTGFIMSIGRGIGYTFLRFGAGIYDIATFPFPGRTDYKPVMEPETIIDKVAETTINQALPTAA
ncbi:MAG: exosortase system-associated protein, TIGR04073 family [Candidatus Omnitrophota bacterium]|jgi:putative exosortase-associated protein (TIGR04073 family)